MKNTTALMFALLAAFLTFYCCSKKSVTTKEATSSSIVKMSKQERIEQAYELEFLKTRNPKTNTIPKERLFEAKRYTRQLLREKGEIPGISWEERGPDNVGGRTRAIIFDASDATNNTVWAAGVAGGIWKSTNFQSNPPTWNKIDDFFDNMAITSILQDPGNPSILYFGTGEGWFNGDAVRGLGIWKSTNGGTSWTQLSSTNNSTFYYIQDLIIDTYGNLYAATRNGLQRSTDGGATWTQVISGRFADLELGADNDIYATEGISNTGVVWKSDNTTHGTSLGESGNWVDITPSGSFRRIELATAPSNANRVYILCQSSSSSNVSDIFRSDNASGNSGISWTSLTVPTIIDQNSDPANYPIFTRNQAWYDLIAAVDPNNADIIYIGGIDALRSTDAGANWTQISTWALFNATDEGYGSDQNVHADHHMITFEPGSSTNAIWGTDGGLDWTTDADNTVDFPSWISKNNDYNVTQYYSCATSNEVGGTNFLAGSQDNGTQRYTSAGVNSTTSVSGGDGGYCHIDEDDPNVQIASFQNNGFRVTTNAWGSRIDTPVPGGTFTSISDYDSKFNIMYAASSNSEFGFIKDVGTNNTTGTTTLANQNNSISAITVSPNTDKRVFFGLRNGRILKVDNADAAVPSSTIITPSDGNSYCSSIAVEVDNDDHLLATYSNYGVTSIYETTDGGSNWTAVEGNLPDMPVRWAVFNPNDSDQALVATEMGVWSTDNLDGGSTDWEPTNTMLANTRIDMLQVRPTDHIILAATHGRGLFTTDDLGVAKASFVNGSQTINETSASNSCPDFTDINIPIQMLASALSVDATIDITVEGTSTAIEGQDFDILNDPFTFTTGGGNTQNLTLRIYDDGIVETNETIVLSINVTNTGASGAVNGTLLQTTITIEDNDILPTVTSENTQTIGSFSFLSSTPFDGDAEDSRYQYIILASELTSAGFVKGSITEYALNINAKNSTIPFSNLSIKMGATNLSALPNFTDISTTEVFLGDYSTTTSWNNFVLTTAFQWDGLSNILIDICFNNSATSGRDFIVTYNDGGTGNPTVYRAENGIDACSISNASFIDNLKPYTRLKIVSSANAETTANESAEEQLGPNETVYFYSNTDNELIAKIENTSNHDYGCTSISLDRTGTTDVDQLGVETLSKTLLITPTNNNASGTYSITLYYTEAEMSGYEASNTSGNNRNSLVFVKSSGAISSATSFETISAVQTTLPSGDLAYTATISTGFSGFGLAGNTPLPVELLYFKGEHTKDHNHLVWETATEIHNEGFYVERSMDGQNFEPIDFVKGAGSSLEKQKYELRDYKVQLGETHYYRLKQMDFDGQSEYSEIISITTNNDKNFELSIAPNPANTITNLNYTLAQDSKVNIQLLDLNGKIIQSILEDTQQAKGTYSFTLVLTGLTQGLYFVKIESQNKRIVKKLTIM